MFNKTRNSFVISYDNINVLKYVILSWYGFQEDLGYPTWKYTLEICKCRNFLCIDTDPKTLYDVNVPLDGFNLLLEVLSVYDLSQDRRLVNSLRKNLPVALEYDALYDLLGKDNEAVINELLKKDRLIMYLSGDEIKIWNSDLRSDEKISFSYSATCAVFSPDRTMIIFGNCSGWINIWNIATKKLISWNAHILAVRHVCVSTNSQIIISADLTSFGVWNIDGSRLYFIKYADRRIRAITISIDNKYAAICYQNYPDIDIRDLSTNVTDTHRISLHHRFSCITFSPDNITFAAASENEIILYEFKTNLGHILVSNIKEVNNLIFSSDGKQIISTNKFKIKIWDVKTGQLVRSIKHHHRIDWIAYQENDKLFVTIDQLHVMHLRDSETGEYLDDLKCGGYIHHASFSQ
jgi:WD40 repeat protein